MTLRDLPSVDRLTSELHDGSLPRSLVVAVVRDAIEEVRHVGDGAEPSQAREVARRQLDLLARQRPVRIINATGVILHTNLGRALLSPDAAAAATTAHLNYGNVEFDLATGERGARAPYLRRLAAHQTGAEDALVVNNNAGALFLVLLTLAAGRPVPVSRGELIEIGGSYRLPDLIAASGVVLLEIGTTNRTRLADYRAALTHQPALLLKVHPSNYRVEGFTEATELRDLVTLGHGAGLPVVFDAGSGLLDQNAPWLAGPTPPWLEGEPGIRQAVETGADLVLFSGDKLLGGPQAGIIVGRTDLIDQLRRHPAARALRIDAATAAALTVTLEAYASGQAGDLPVWKMAASDRSHLEARAQAILTTTGIEGRIVEGHSTWGAGSAPGALIPGPVIEIAAPQGAFTRLLGSDPPVLARRYRGLLIIDVRTVSPDEDQQLAAALRAACRS